MQACTRSLTTADDFENARRAFLTAAKGQTYSQLLADDHPLLVAGFYWRRKVRRPRHAGRPPISGIATSEIGCPP
ncbi:hypothetical protein GA829_35945 (plasmid) [Mesorhizobium sp. INR15]|nr:hypothetical protein GA829_35945 [Mesorhizobium sp. INR15]